MGAWIEMYVVYEGDKILVSHPTMGAWIEIRVYSVVFPLSRVAPHDGCVD